MATLVLPVKGIYFEQIREGAKREEYRLVTPYWTRRIEGRTYDKVEITLGYPAAGDKSRRIVRPWRGYTIKTITHPHFGQSPVRVFAIKVSA